MSKSSFSFFAMILFFSGVLFAYAGIQYEPENIRLVPPESDLKALLWTNKPTGSMYLSGEEMVIHFKTNKDAYVTILDILPNGKIKVLFPNKFEKDNFIQADVEYTLPGTSSEYRLLTGDITGKEVFILIASTEPLYFLDPVFIRLQYSIFTYFLSDVTAFVPTVTRSLDNVPWTVAATYHYINYLPNLQRVRLDSDRPNTKVYVDGLYSGIAPVELKLEEGKHSVYMFNDKELAYGPDVINVSAVSRQFDFQLFPTYPYGFIDVFSDPVGANVYVDGKYVGKTPYHDFARVGYRSVRVSKWKYHSVTQEVYVDEGEVSTIDVQLVPKTEEEIRKEINTMILVMGIAVSIIALLIILSQ
ncbi:MULTISPECIES: PEGA domain-containing protein [Kosmotoga]|uniref:PEGA domain protein n=1 Tax=Kosmotoga olearia (strain ATCC BAA-1733 / DSM 21960 / TBF 19.5.1) TaxID=521045 RepID=C5CGP3_KOSOT|nr:MULTISPECIES: PEGA domain-containing protein [Kosmotoga]ACR79622.1 PEGA domain protein [Kosmotoga olearia TBF 19.5.1]MDK2953110.1 hypothetical protein [Kosmotoga sp.]OAA22168.1 hypothetical protein DU53_04810 [Kosmotoga sp. DU53]